MLFGLETKSCFSISSDSAFLTYIECPELWGLKFNISYAALKEIYVEQMCSEDLQCSMYFNEYALHLLR